MRQVTTKFKVVSFLMFSILFLCYNFINFSSGDGCLGVLDIRKGVLEAMSDNLEDELLSIVILKVKYKY